MSTDNPFAEPDDDADRTVIRPVTGAARPQPAPPPFQPSPAPAAAPLPAEGGAAEIPRIGINPLASLAAPLLDLLARLGPGRVAAPPGGVAELRERAVRAVAAFRQAASAAGIAPEQVEAAQYALCAALDDVVLATPWGATSIWAAQSLISTFHKEVRSGERFFQILQSMQREPGRYGQALEIAYLCLALGFRGRYRLEPRGASDLERVREELYGLLAGRRPEAAPTARDLSPRWRGVDAPHRPIGRSVPAWVAGALAAALLGFGYVGLAMALNDEGDALMARTMRLPPATLPEIQRAAAVVPPAPPPPSAAPARPDVLERLRTFLAPEIAAHQVVVAGDAQMVMVRVRNRGVFASGSATPDPRFRNLLERIGQALREEPGRIFVLGHTDSQPIRTVRFPSNFHLSVARAEAVRDLLGAVLGDPSRVAAEGRADTEPLAPNTTAEGREENRRIEILLMRSNG
mgnify:CR=1 FL=1